jgi:hypothetical protein
MKKTILRYGLISGLVSAALMLATVPFLEKIGNNFGYVVGYTGMVLSFLLVYFGVRSYRDEVGGGQITFGRAFAVGLGITLISCVFYVVTWEIVYFNFMPHFMDDYGKRVLEQARAAGASAATLDAKMKEIQHVKEVYQNPLLNALMTFIEPFPVGLVITLLSAAVLRKKPSVPVAGEMQAY